MNRFYRRYKSLNRVLIYMVTIASLFTFNPNSYGLSVEEAYRAIPHQRTIFDEQAAVMPVNEKKFLSEFFVLVDLAMVERVGILLWLTTRGEKGNVAQGYPDILNKLNALEVPNNLREVHRQVIEAIEQQRQFLDEWKEKGVSSMDIHAHPKVISASEKLRSAYSLLMQAYPKENARNKQAFFDYLCALDFI